MDYNLHEQSVCLEGNHKIHLTGSTTSTVNVPGFSAGRGRGLSAVFSGVGPNSAVGK
jgi:hypothetical protein